MKGLRRHTGSQESSSQCERNDEKRNDVPLHLNPQLCRLRKNNPQ